METWTMFLSPVMMFRRIVRVLKQEKAAKKAQVAR